MGESRSGHPWCFPYGKADRKDGGNRITTAIREGCEEICYALGTTQHIWNTYFRGKRLRRWGGAYHVHIGMRTSAQRDEIRARHIENRNGDGLRKLLGRRPKGCEREMRKINWIEGGTFLRHAGGSIPGFGKVRGFCANIMRSMARDRDFRRLCAPTGPGAPQQVVSPGAAAQNIDRQAVPWNCPRCTFLHE